MPPWWLVESVGIDAETQARLGRWAGFERRAKGWNGGPMESQGLQEFKTRFLTHRLIFWLDHIHLSGRAYSGFYLLQACPYRVDDAGPTPPRSSLEAVVTRGTKQHLGHKALPHQAWVVAVGLGYGTSTSTEVRAASLSA
jgi:hypothetical protein